jgi:hypothetical protein
MTVRLLAFFLAACAFGISTGCYRSRGDTDIVPVPTGLDSIGLARWLGQQEAACRGHLVRFLDEGGATRDFDSVGGRAPVRYLSGLVGVACRRER